MPALVPPGFTRGPILFTGPHLNEQSAATLLQRFWDEAGSYGARILILPTATNTEATDACADLFRSWETEWIQILTVQNRASAQDLRHQELIDAATAILVIEDNPLHFTSLVGGTPMAQALRRANARGKVIGGVGRGAAALCQHMIAFERGNSAGLPLLQRRLIQLAPGLGLINRIVLDIDLVAGNVAHAGLGRLLSAIAYNPFLIGVSLESGTGVVIYSDNTLEVFGAGSALVIDGAGMSFTDVHDYERAEPISLLGVHLHGLAHGYTFNLEARTVCPPVASDIPASSVPAQSKSSF